MNTLLTLLAERFSVFGLLPVLFPIGAVVAMWVANVLGKRLPVVPQVAKFGLVGVLNTFVDLGVLNLFIAVTGIAAGFSFSVFKAVSFTAAVVNSYLWNKFWTFKAQEKQEKRRGEFAQFLLVSVGGFLVNVGAASLVVNVFGPIGGVDERLWANVAALVATVLSLVWNFVGYKFFVFKQQKPPQAAGTFERPMR